MQLYDQDIDRGSAGRFEKCYGHWVVLGDKIRD